MSTPVLNSTHVVKPQVLPFTPVITWSPVQAPVSRASSVREQKKSSEIGSPQSKWARRIRIWWWRRAQHHEGLGTWNQKIAKCTSGMLYPKLKLNAIIPRPSPPWARLKARPGPRQYIVSGRFHLRWDTPPPYSDKRAYSFWHVKFIGQARELVYPL